MPVDYYSDGESAGAATSEAPPAEEPQEDSGGSTALLPKSFFPGGSPQPGKECTVRVVRVQDDQVEVEYSEKGGDEPTAPEAAPEPQSDFMT